MSLRTSLFGNLQVSDAAKASSHSLGEQVRTVIGVTSTEVKNLCELTVRLNNTGATAIRLFPKMDVIVQFPGENNPAVALLYATDNPDMGQWSVTSISGLFEPGIWNPGEDLTIDGLVPLTDDGDGIVTISTPNGIVAEATFDEMESCD